MELALLGWMLLPLLAGWLAIRDARLVLLMQMASLGTWIYGWLHFVPITWRFHWFLDFSVGFQLDKLSLLLIGLVLLIGFLVQGYALKYISGDQQPRFFGILGGFIFSMVGLLLTDHLLLLFVFWELVGFCSFLLVGFWYTKTGVGTAARWTFITNRLADVAFLIAILWQGAQDGYYFIEWKAEVSPWVAWGFLLAAMAKSAQWPFSAWLPRAMAGPTPVSALIHAATMVAAGVYLLIRTVDYFPIQVIEWILFVGVGTAFLGAISAATQHDIKRVLAYSTISQLGFMFAAVGTGATSAAFFHLWTHAFFKAGLFLIAGLVVDHYHQRFKHLEDTNGTVTNQLKGRARDFQDMRLMGGLAKKLPHLFLGFVIFGAALAGLPFTSGFMSKDGILEAVWSWANITSESQMHNFALLLAYLLYLTVFLTGLYVARLVVLIFLGKQRLEITTGVNGVQPSLPASGLSLGYLWVLGVLIVGSLWFSYDWNPLSTHTFIQHAAGMPGAENRHGLGWIVSVLLVVAGIAVGYMRFGPESPYGRNYQYYHHRKAVVERLASAGFYLEMGYSRLARLFELIVWLSHFIEKKILDRLIHFIKVVAVVLAKLSAVIDRHVVDGIVRGVGTLSLGMGWLLSRLQSGRAQWQLIWLLIGFVFILAALLFL